MKGFLIGLVISTLLMFGVVYATVLNPSLLTNLFGAGEVSEETSLTEFEEANQANQPNQASQTKYLDRIEKGNTLMESNYYHLAAIEYQFAAELEPNLSEPFQKLGEAYFYDENYEAALENLTIATTNNSSNLSAQVLLGKTYLALGQFEAAETHFEGLEPPNQEILYYRGVLNAYSGDYEAATSDFEAAIALGESAEISQNAQNYLSSIQEASLTQDADPTYLKILVGRSLAETGETSLAINLIYEVLREEPNYRDAWIILGYAYLTLEKYEEAQDALIKALELDSTKAETRYFLGLSYFGQEEWESAIVQLELAIESGFEPRVQAYQKFGDAAVLAPNYEKAAEAYENVLVLNSSDVELYIRPIWLYIDHLNNLERALELGEQAIQDHPNEAMSYNLLGWALTAANDFEKAEQNLNYALILDPDLAAAYLNLGWWHQKRDEIEAAQENYKRAYTLDPGGSVGNLAAERYNSLAATP